MYVENTFIPNIKEINLSQKVKIVFNSWNVCVTVGFSDVSRSINVIFVVVLAGSPI